LNSYPFEISNKTFPKEVLFYSVKYSPMVTSFDFDETTKPDTFIFNIVTSSNDIEVLQRHIMERIQFSFLRYEISQKTRTERELIVGRALYRSCVSVDEEE